MEPDLPPRFAPVMPIGVAHQLSSSRPMNVIGNYHLLLAHDVADPKNAQTYADIYELNAYQKADGEQQRGITIMDNSVIELGRPIDALTMSKACNIVNANVAVLPDELLDRPGTIEAIRRSTNEWDMHLDGIEFMAVPQGNTWEEWLLCMNQIVELPEFERISWIGVPKNVRRKLGVSRRVACEAVNILTKSNINIHLLGFSHDLYDDVVSAVDSYNVQGIDSAVPVRMGLRDGLPTMMGLDYPGRGDWWENPGDNIKMAAENIMRVRGMLGE